MPEFVRGRLGNPVREDRYGAYLGVRQALLTRFVCREADPNFEVYDSRDGRDRIIVAKSSRIPDDEDKDSGRYGIDFNRPKPSLSEALRYGAELPHGYQWLNGAAFAAGSEEEYEKKSQVWDRFYSYVWGASPLTIWVAPHSGSVNRAADDVIFFPKRWIDSFTAGVAARCALMDSRVPSKRVMIAVHATGHLGGVLNLGDFGLLSQQDLDAIIPKIEAKHGEQVQALAEAFKQEFCETTAKTLEVIQRRRGTLDPEVLSSASRTVSYDDSVTVSYCAKGLALYGRPINEFTLQEFKRAMAGLRGTPVPVVTTNYFYTGRKVGGLLKLPDKISQRMLGSALSIECARFYCARDPELVSDLILDVVNKLFGQEKN